MLCEIRESLRIVGVMRLRITLQSNEESLRKSLGRFREVAAAYLFGSHARGQAGPLSDIDVALLVKGRPNLSRLLELVGIVMEIFGDTVDVGILNELPLPVQYRVISYGKLLYVGDDLERSRQEAKIIDEYLDCKPWIDAILEAWLRR